MAKETFQRTKPHVNVGTIGHIDHGKTTLTAAIVARQAYKNKLTGKVKSYAEISKGGTVRDENKTVTIAVSHVEYETPNRHYAHIDCPGPRRLYQEHDHRRRPDGRRDPGGRRQRRPHAANPEHILLARQVGVPRIVVFMNKVDTVDDPELLDLVELELRELLTKYEFPGDEIPIVRGSSKPALDTQGKDDAAGKCIDDLMTALDSYIPEPKREEDKPFLMSVEDVFSIEGRGTVATGRIERGVCKVGDEVEIIGLMKAPKKTTITGVEMFNKTLDKGIAGDNVGVLVRGLKREEIERGQVLAKPGSITPHTKFEANVYVLSKEEGGRHTPFFAGYRPQFYFRTTDVTGSIIDPDRRRRQQGGNVHAGRQHQGQRRTAARQPHRHGRTASASPSAKGAAPSAPAS